MGEVENFQHAEDDGQAARHQHEDHAQGQAVQNGRDQGGKIHQCRRNLKVSLGPGA